MAFGSETIGNYNVRRLPNGMYSVSVNNGNIGAGMWSEEAVNKLREKYSPNGDNYVSSGTDAKTEKPKMTYEDAKKIYLFGSGKWGWDNIKLLEEAEQVMIYHETNWVKDKIRSLFRIS